MVLLGEWKITEISFSLSYLRFKAFGFAIDDLVSAQQT